MDYQIYEYGETVVKRSLNYYENKNENNFHMISGLTSELTEELIVALDKNDMVNILEELGDATFFNVGSMIHNNYWDIFKEKIAETDTLLLDLGFDWSDQDYSKKLTPSEKKEIFNTVIFTMYKSVGALNTIYKNILVKDIAKYNGEVLSPEQVCSQHCNLMICINTLTVMLGSNFQKVREINDKKLFARHNGGTLTADSSNNRDTDAERKIMEETAKN